MIEGVAIGKALCLASCVTYGMVALSGMSGGRGVQESGNKGRPSGLTGVALGGALLAQLIGLSFLYDALGRPPSHGLDGLVLGGALMAAIGLWLGRLKAHPVVRAPLAGGAFVTSTLSFALMPEAHFNSTWESYGIGLLTILVSALLFSLGVMSFRRFLRRNDGGRMASIVACTLILAALWGPWGGTVDDSRPFEVLNSETGETVQATAVVRSLEGAATRVEIIPVRVHHEGLNTGRLICIVLVLMTLLFTLLEWSSPTLFYRSGLFLFVVTSALAGVVLLVSMGWVLWSYSPVSQEMASSFEGWLQQWAMTVPNGVLFEVDQLRWSAPEGMVLGVGSSPVIWFTLLTTVPLLAITGAYRARALTSPVRNQDAEEESNALARAELGLLNMSLVVSVCWLSASVAWSMARYGAPELGDVRTFLILAILGTQTFYLFECKRGLEGANRSQVLGIILGVLGLIFLIGPSFGWTLPSIYSPIP